LAGDRELGFEVKQAFQTRTFGKWILAGEHAVLRGCPAVAFPLVSRSLELSYDPSVGSHEVEFAGPHGEELKLLFYGVLENALSRLNIGEGLMGRFRLQSSLPVGAGLGASAALCGAVARWCESQGWVKSSDLYEFARKLEDLFHGESSGVDLAVSLSAQGLKFQRGGERTPLSLGWQPRLYLSYSGQRGMTAECVGRVKRMFETHESKAIALDEQMRRAVELALLALQGDAQTGVPQLKTALDLARSCFEDWDLCGGDLGRHMRMLEEAGAIAVKPTGSGGGGYALSLWEQEPNPDLRDQLVPCF